MPDARHVKIADVLINYSIGLKSGQKLLIRASTLAEPLIREVYRQALRVGGLVTLQLSVPGYDRIFLDEAGNEQLDWVQPLFKTVVETYDAYLAIEAVENTRESTGSDLEKQARSGRSMKPYRDKLIQRGADGDLRWCVTLFPAPAHAQDAEMSVEAYEDFVYGACLPDLDDPVGFWQRMENRQSRLIEHLQKVSEIRVLAPETDLTVHVAGRTWINCAGRENFPDGEVFTGPVETATQGTVRFTYPAVHRGNEVTDVKLTFDKGRVVDSSASKGEDFLLDMLDRDEGARVLGEFAIGTNPGIDRFTRNTLFDEKIQGTVHMAVGSSYPESGGTNESQIHWDMVCDLRASGSILADGVEIFKNGRFLIDLPDLAL
jgi:aminopeptidase